MFWIINFANIGGLMGWLLPSGPSRFAVTLSGFTLLFQQAKQSEATVDMDISLTVCGLQQGL